MTDPDKVTNTEIQTNSGEMFNVFYPEPAKIHLNDIAHALSNICRYGGHSLEFYSVATHSRLMAEYFISLGLPDLARVALFHDASEAYAGDMVRPLKLQMPEYRLVEEHLQRTIFKVFGLEPFIPVDIKEADLRICNDERAVLMRPRPWVIDHLPPLGIEVHPEPPGTSRIKFIDVFFELFPGGAGQW